MAATDQITRIEVFLSTDPGERILGRRLAELLRDWVDRTAHGDEVVDVAVSPQGDEAVARLRSADRMLEVRAHHDGGPESHRLWLETRTWVAPALPSPLLFIGLGVLAGLIGLGFTFLALNVGATPLTLGLVGSVLLAVLVANLSWRATVYRRIRTATEASGGQAPAQDLLAQIGSILRSDERVARIDEV